MALVVFDRVQETTATTGTGTITLGGAVAGYQTFAVVGNGNTTFYCILNGSDWEVGIGTYSTTGPTLARTTVLSNSSGTTSPITLVGASSVFVTYPSEKSVNLDASGNVTALGTITSGVWNGSTVPVAYGGTGVTASSGANSVVLRDANQNVAFNNFTASAVAVTAAAGTTTLTVASARTQILVGSTTQTFQLPNATTLQLGQSFIFVNNSSGLLTVTNNSGATVETVPAGGVTQLSAVSIATSAGSWGAYSFIPAAVNWGTNSLDLASTVITGGTWNGGTIGTAYGGTGITSFTSGGAVYATSTSALTTGTLPVTAGGTGQTSFSSGYIPYGNSSAALQSSSLLQFNGTYLQVGGGSVLGGATNPIAAFTQSTNNYVQTYTYNANTGTSASSDFVAYTNNSTDAHGWADIGYTSSTYADAVYTITGPNEAYVLGSAPTGAGATGNLVYATDNTGSANAHQWYVGGFTQAKSAWKMQLTSTGLQLANALAPTYGGTGLTSLTAGYIPFGAGTSAFGNSVNLFWDSANSRLGINTNAPAGAVHSVGDIICQTSLNAAATYYFQAKKSRGTAAVPLTVSNGDGLGGLLALPYDGTAFRSTGAIQFLVNGTVATNSVPTDIVFYSGAASVPTSGVNERMRITSTGGISFGTTGTAYGTSGQVLTSAGNAPPTWATPTTGTVTSVALSGGTTGITVSGSPITTAGTITLAGTLVAANGGTGQTSYAVGDLLYASTTTALSKLADVATGNALISGGVGVAPSYGKIGLTTHVSGTLPVANGGTGVTTSTGSGNVVLSTSPTLVTPALGTPSSGTLTNCTFPTLNQNTTGSAATLTTGRTIAITGDLTYTSGSFNGSANVTGTGTLANSGVTAGTYLSANITVDAKGRVTAASAGSDPAVTIYTSGSGTYTTPANTRYLTVEMVGAGGGGAAPGSSSINGTIGGQTTFGTAVCGGGGGGTTNDNGGDGGSISFFTSGAVGVSFVGSAGGPNSSPSNGAEGGCGGTSPFGGAGKGIGGSNYSFGGNAAAGSGSGGGGAGGSNGGQPFGAGGGGSGGYISAMITAPAATYSYSVGAGGAGGNNGSVIGGSGGSGLIIVTAYF